MSNIHVGSNIVLLSDKTTDNKRFIEIFETDVVYGGNVGGRVTDIKEDNITIIIPYMDHDGIEISIVLEVDESDIKLQEFDLWN